MFSNRSRVYHTTPFFATQPFVALNNSEEAHHITLATGQKAALLVATEKAVALRLDNQLDLPPFAGALYQLLSSENGHSGGW